MWLMVCYQGTAPLDLHCTDTNCLDGVTLTARTQENASPGMRLRQIPSRLTSRRYIEDSRSGSGTCSQPQIEKYRELIPKYIFILVAIETLDPMNKVGVNFLCDLGSQIKKITQDCLETTFSKEFR